MTDLEKLQGRWYVNTLEIDGAALSSECFAGAEIFVENDRFTSASMGAVYEGTIKLEPSKKPKTLTMAFTKGPEQGNTNHGIYELGSKGWKLCLTMNGGPAPVAFATTPGSGQALETLTRHAPAARPENPITETAPAGGTAGNCPPGCGRNALRRRRR